MYCVGSPFGALLVLELELELEEEDVDDAEEEDVGAEVVRGSPVELGALSSLLSPPLSLPRSMSGVGN